LKLKGDDKYLYNEDIKKKKSLRKNLLAQSSVRFSVWFLVRFLVHLPLARLPYSYTLSKWSSVKLCVKSLKNEKRAGRKFGSFSKLELCHPFLHNNRLTFICSSYNAASNGVQQDQVRITNLN